VQTIGSATHTTVTRSNFGIKSFYPKIGGHVLTPKFGSRGKYPEVKICQRKAKILNEIG
jgi:polyisoprenoid-binding protein YceI